MNPYSRRGNLFKVFLLGLLIMFFIPVVYGDDENPLSSVKDLKPTTFHPNNVNTPNMSTPDNTAGIIVSVILLLIIYSTYIFVKNFYKRKLEKNVIFGGKKVVNFWVKYRARYFALSGIFIFLLFLTGVITPFMFGMIVALPIIVFIMSKMGSGRVRDDDYYDDDEDGDEDGYYEPRRYGVPGTSRSSVDRVVKNWDNIRFKPPKW